MTSRRFILPVSKAFAIREKHTSRDGFGLVLGVGLSLLMGIAVALVLSVLAVAPAKAQTRTLAASEVPLDASWSVLIRDVRSDTHIPFERPYRFLGGSDIRVQAHVEVTTDSGTHPVAGASVVFTLGEQRAQAQTDAIGNVVVMLPTGTAPARLTLDAFLITGQVEQSPDETVILYDYAVEMAESIEVDSSGARTTFLDAQVRQREPDANGNLTLVPVTRQLARDMEAVRFIAAPELELQGENDRSGDARLYEAVPDEAGRLTFGVRSEWEGEYSIRAVGIGGAYRLRDTTLGETRVRVTETVLPTRLAFGPSMERYADGPDRITIPDVPTDLDTPITLEIIALVNDVPAGDVDVRTDIEPGSEIVLIGSVLTSFMMDGAVRPEVWRPGPGPQTLTVSADDANTLTIVVVGVDPEEVAECPQAMHAVAERQGGLEACGTGRPDPARAPHALDGIWDVTPGASEDEAIIAYIREHQSAAFAADGRRTPVAVASFLNPANAGLPTPWPARIGHDFQGPDAMELRMRSAPVWNLSGGGDGNVLEGTWWNGFEEFPARAVRRSATPQVNEVIVSYAPPGALLASQRREVDRFAPDEREAGRLPLTAVDHGTADGTMCRGPAVLAWITLMGEGFAGGHDVWIDPASHLEISPQSGWVCAEGSVSTIDGGMGEGWGNCTLGQTGDPAETVTGISIGLCPRFGVESGPVDVWLNGEALPFEIEVFESAGDVE
eukprot:g17380.t1